MLLSLSVLATSASARARRTKAKRSKAARAVLKFAPATPFTTVVIDAGHGGFDRGGIRQNLIVEKDVALDVAHRLEQSLRKAGLKTVMTRSDDRFVTLNRRVAIANAQRDAIFMCIHFNSALRREARGIETYYAAASEARLASRIQQNLAATTDGVNRGVKRAGFRVLRKTRIRAVLAECGFLTNPQDVALAKSSGYRQKLAEQISRAIVEDRNSLQREHLAQSLSGRPTQRPLSEHVQMQVRHTLTRVGPAVDYHSVTAR